MQKIYKIFATIVFITVLPLLVIELMIKRKYDFASQIESSFYLMLFVVELGSQNH